MVNLVGMLLNPKFDLRMLISLNHSILEYRLEGIFVARICPVEFASLRASRGVIVEDFRHFGILLENQHQCNKLLLPLLGDEMLIGRGALTTPAHSAKLDGTREN